MGTDIHGILQAKYGSNDNASWFRECAIEDGRNYHVFAALAGVRNGVGFAGVPTHRPIDPIDDPRGWPADFNLKSIGYGEDEPWLGDHSFSWLTLDEVAAWPGWDQELEECGIIDRDQFTAWSGEGPPKGGWCGGISGRDVVTVDERNPGQWVDNWTHIRVYWSRPLRDSCKAFLKWVDYARAKTEGYEARIVFGFDS